LWHIQHHSEKNDDQYSFGITIDQALSREAAQWSQAQHRQFLGQPMATGPTASNNSSDVAFTAAITAFREQINVLQDHRINNSASTISKSTNTFEALPATTKRLLLHATALTAAGAAPKEPTPAYQEILDYKNVSFVRDHLHHYLRREPQNLDVYLPNSICVALRTASFVSENTDRPGLFSLFSCFRQIQHHSDLSQTELAQMNLKAHETTTGLTDKDIAKLVKGYHHSPVDFVELSTLLQNFHGVTSFVFHAASLVSQCLVGWVRFLGRGSLQPQLRSLTQLDPKLPAKVGWHIERRLQRYLNSCAEQSCLNDVDTSLLSFTSLRLCLEEGRDFGLTLCDALDQKFAPPPPPVTPSPPPNRERPRPRTLPDPRQLGNQVSNSKPIYRFDQAKDDWLTFVQHMGSCPSPGACLRYHLKGNCFDDCSRASSHHPITQPDEVTGMKSWVSECKA
jgi:hypothetical protein